MKKLFLILLTVIALQGINAQENATVINGEFILHNFYKREYLRANEVVPVSYTSSGDKDRRPLSNAFDDDWVNVWQSAANSGEQSITVTFSEANSISKIICGLRDRNPFPNGEGYPQTIKVYTSNDETGDDFTYQFAMTSEWTSDKQLFVFPYAVDCHRMKLVFEDVFCTYDGGGYAEIAELMFLKEDAPFDEVMRMFTDREQTIVDEKYKDERLLDRLEQSIIGNRAETFLKWRIIYARNIIQGKITSEDFPYPVTVYQKHGPDSEKFVMAFFPDRYTVDDEATYNSVVAGHIETVFSEEPFKSMRDAFNIYIVFVPSNENYCQYCNSTNDSYFETYIGDAGDGGVARLSTFTQRGQERATNIIDEFSEKYLDEGGEVRCANFLMNCITHGGAAQPFLNGVQGTVYTAGSGARVLVHELGHAIGSLCDEYVFFPYEDSNMTAESDGYKSKWAEFMGFRNVTHRHVADGYYRPSGFCAMENTNLGFCEVCKLAIFEKIDDAVAGKNNLYMADPIVYYNYTNEYPSKLVDGMMSAINGQQLQFRTVVKNKSESNITLKLEFTIVSNDGTTERFEKITEEYTIKPEELKSLTVTTPEAVSGIEDNDKVWAQITNVTTGEMLFDNDTYKKDYGTVRSIHYLGDAGTETNNQVARTSFVNYQAGSDVEITHYDIHGYTYQKSSGGSYITIQKDVTNDVKHYYTKNRGNVNIAVYDENGGYEQTITRSVDYGMAYLPSESDLPAREGMVLLLPESSEVYDGINDIELTYHWSVKSDDGTTAIEETANGDEENIYYDMMGNRVVELIKGRMYITNNKVFIAR